VKDSNIELFASLSLEKAREYGELLQKYLKDCPIEHLEVASEADPHENA